MLAFVDLEERVPKDHLIRTIRAMADETLDRLSGEFDRMYSEVGRAAVPPERLVKASLLIFLYSLHRERVLFDEAVLDAVLDPGNRVYESSGNITIVAVDGSEIRVLVEWKGSISRSQPNEWALASPLGHNTDLPWRPRCEDA